MGLFSKLFRRKNRQEVLADDWESIVYDRGDVNFRDQEQRYEYIKSCLEQMEEAEREVQLLTGEYSVVTSYLTDIEEIEALPEEEREELNGIARRLMALEQERQRYQGRENRMMDGDFYRLRKQEDEIQEGIGKLKECENYGAVVRQDMQRLDRERHAYEYRRQELDVFLNNLRGMVVIFITAFGLCIILLLVLQFFMDMNTREGYLLAVAAIAIAVTCLWVKYTDGDRELRHVEKAINKLIQLQNKVKIRYVNNKNLCDYLCVKYGTKNAASLERLWYQYLDEREERKQYAEAEAKTEYYQRQLIDRMSNYRVASPERWIGQPAALLDKREMVEIRHDLIVRRQALRKQMDYNNDVADTASKEIQDIADKYPAYAPEIMEMVAQYRQG
ncbi:MAG: hypothetical protein HFH82_10335 [Lachnospiraceae bacterium]|nr:hypothetical protein [Lachnospiraceae bacterium]